MAQSVTASSPHVLIVDDDSNLAEMMDIALTQAGFRTTVCGDGLKAIDDFVRVSPELGADDYIVKPCSTNVLSARVRARLRPTPDTLLTAQTYELEDITVDTTAHRVMREGREISLTPLEFSLLVTLVSQPHRVLTREELLEQVWGYQYKADTRLVNVHVQRLRSKVEHDPDNPLIVRTVRGVGYRAGGD